MTHRTSVNIVLAVAVLASIGYIVTSFQERQTPKPTPVDRPDTPSEPVEKIDSQYDVIYKKDCTIELPDQWAGDRISIMEGGKAFSFSLYFVSCPAQELTDRTRDSLRMHANYFGSPPMDELLRMGTAAREFTMETLRNNDFRILTRFEPTGEPNNRRFAFIQVYDTETNTLRYLSAMLVSDGLASITGKPSHTPFGQNRRDFLKFLEDQRKDAQHQLNGIWNISRLANEAARKREREQGGE